MAAIRVAVGRQLGVKVKYRNTSPDDETFIWRLQLNPGAGLSGWNEGSDADWESQTIAGGATAEVEIYRMPPATWRGIVYAKLQVRTEKVAWVDKLVDPNPAWDIMEATPEDIEIIEIFYLTT